MDATTYQEKARRTLIDRPDFRITEEEVMILWAAFGIAGESGEVLDRIKKDIFHQQGLHKEEIKKELGDLLWYIAALCTKLGLDLGEVMEHNIAKLLIRFPDGWDHKATLNRRDLFVRVPQDGLKYVDMEPIHDDLSSGQGDTLLT